jgi:enterochelin esterase-like enzyme
MDKLRFLSHPLFVRLLGGLSLFLGLFLTGCASHPPVPPPATQVMIAPTLAPTITPLPVPPTPTPIAPEATSAPLGCGTTTGTIEKGVIVTQLLDKPMRYNVYLPPCYRVSQIQRYPVLYLLHGQNYDEGQWLRLGVATTLDRLIAAGEVKPFIVVMPFDYSFKQPTEYGFEEAFTQLLVPQIDLTYRTNRVAWQRAVGGLSRGGAWAIRLGTRHPELFGAIGGHSPAIFYADMQTLQMRLLELPADRFPRFWLDVGDSDSEYATVVAFEQFLSQNNLPHEWHAYIGWHDEAYWSAHVAEYLRWYAEEWKQ